MSEKDSEQDLADLSDEELAKQLQRRGRTPSIVVQSLGLVHPIQDPSLAESIEPECVEEDHSESSSSEASNGFNDMRDAARRQSSTESCGQRSPISSNPSSASPSRGNISDSSPKAAAFRPPSNITNNRRLSLNIGSTAPRRLSLNVDGLPSMATSQFNKVKQTQNDNSPTTGSYSTGNATGSLRNKVALKPGHSLMGWIQYAATAKDLSGTDGKKIEVTAEELAKHDKQDDCWISIKDKVYNVTKYLQYHPGGVEELMRGAGRDATELFNEIHIWVNYESILAKCLVGPYKPG